MRRARGAQSECTLGSGSLCYLHSSSSCGGSAHAHVHAACAAAARACAHAGWAEAVCGGAVWAIVACWPQVPASEFLSAWACACVLLCRHGDPSAVGEARLQPPPGRTRCARQGPSHPHPCWRPIISQGPGRGKLPLPGLHVSRLLPRCCASCLFRRAQAAAVDGPPPACLCAQGPLAQRLCAPAGPHAFPFALLPVQCYACNERKGAHGQRGSCAVGTVLLHRSHHRSAHVAGHPPSSLPTLVLHVSHAHLQQDITSPTASAVRKRPLRCLPLCVCACTQHGELASRTFRQAGSGSLRAGRCEPYAGRGPRRKPLAMRSLTHLS